MIPKSSDVQSRKADVLQPTCPAPLRIWLLASVSSIVLASLVLAILVVMLTTRTVQADALISPPVASVPPSVPAVSNAAPALTPKRTLVAQRAAMLRGIATWYGTVFNGRKTANGETFDMYGMTACHPTLPFGSLVKVVNLNNKRSVVVRITDRGYLSEGRIIDLSYGAAEKLAMTEAGVAPVALEVISRGRP
jgi:rare lipoprotein A